MNGKIWNPKIKMELEHRAVVVFDESLKLLKKRVSKSARLERQAFGSGAFTELEEYIEHLERRIGAAYQLDIKMTEQNLTSPSGNKDKI